MKVQTIFYRLCGLLFQVRRDEFFYDCCPNERFSNVAFCLHISRRYTFYVMNVILPRQAKT